MQTYELLSDSASSHDRISPPDVLGSFWLGVFAHFGPVVSYVLALITFGITPLAIACSYAGAAIFLPITFFIERRHPCVDLPPATFDEAMSGYSLVFVKGVAAGGAFVSAGWYLLSFVSPYRVMNESWWVILAAVFFTDLGYYFLHRFMSHGRGSGPLMKVYRKAHSAHHAISNLDFLRGNESSLIDTAFSEIQPALIVVAWAFGMNLEATLVTYGIVLLLQTTDHTNHTFNIGWLKYVFLDNHVHKLHHCRRGHIVNFGAVFSIFDRVFGTYYEDWNLNGSYMHHHRIALPVKRRGGDW